MLFNLLLLFVWAPAFLACGGLLAETLEAEVVHGRNYSPGIFIILGYVPIAITAATLHFFLPLGTPLSIAVLLLGYALFIHRRNTLLKTMSLRSFLGALLVAIIVSLFASRPLHHFDTGLYHMQAIRWCTTFPLVRGLGNLHERLAFNSFWTPIGALVDFPDLPGKSCYPVTCLLLFGFGWAVFDAMRAWNEQAKLIPNLFLAACGCFWSWVITTDSYFVVLPSLSTDAPIYFMTFLCVYFLLRYCAEANLADFSQAIVLSALAVTIKISAAPLFLFLLLFGMVLFWRERHSRRLMVTTTIIIGSLFLLWVARSIFLSGYLVFPVTATVLAFLPWHLPVPMTKQLVDTLKAWARWPGVSPEIVSASSAWISVWLRHLGGKYVSDMLAAYGAIGVSLLLFAGWRGRLPRQLIRFWPAAGMLCLGVAYWLMTVPDLRYGCAFLFALACLLLALGISSLFRPKINRVLVCAAALLPFFSISELPQFHLRDLPDVEKGSASVKRTLQGTLILVAGEDGRIWDGPLPSAPYFRPSLVTRRDAKGRISQFELTEPVYTPYYDRLPPQIRAGYVQARY